MFVRRDVSDAILKSAEDRGVNEKEWIIDPITNQDALFKATQIKDDGTSTYADYAESIVSDICELLHVPCAKIELVRRNGVDGCLSYSFLNDEEELVDIASVIQNVGRNFDSKKMQDVDSKEYYSVEMILEGLESLSETKKDFNRLKREALEAILVDALIDHYDRNPSNISIKRRINEPENLGLSTTSTKMNVSVIHVSEKYDNGTSLSIAVPQDVIKEKIGRPKEIRENVYSKIGYLYNNYIKYPDLESFIFNYYHEDIGDFIKTLRELFKEENVYKILHQEKYADLPEVYKTMIQEKLMANRSDMLERYRKVYKKKIVDKIIFNKSASENFTRNVEGGIIGRVLPDYEACIGKEDEDPNYDLSLDRQVAEKIQNTVDIIPLARYLEIPVQQLTPREKNLLKWNFIIENMQKANPDKDIFAECSDKYGFLKDDIELLSSIIRNRFIDENDLMEIRNIIYGDNGIGEKNVNLYICKKFVDASVMRKELREQRFTELRNLIGTMHRVVELEHIINDGKLSAKARDIIKLGNSQEQTIAILYAVAEAYRVNPRITLKEQREIVKNMTAENLCMSDDKVRTETGAYIDKGMYKYIQENTVTLENGTKLTFTNNTKKSVKDTIFRAGIDYVCQIVEAPDGDGVTMSFITAKGKTMPEGITEYVEELEKDFVNRYGAQDKPYIKSFIAKGRRVSNFYSVASPFDERIKIPGLTQEQMKSIIVDRCQTKSRNMERVGDLK